MVVASEVISKIVMSSNFLNTLYYLETIANFGGTLQHNSQPGAYENVVYGMCEHEMRRAVFHSRILVCLNFSDIQHEL